MSFLQASVTSVMEIWVACGISAIVCTLVSMIVMSPAGGWAKASLEISDQEEIHHRVMVPYNPDKHAGQPDSELYYVPRAGSLVVLFEGLTMIGLGLWVLGLKNAKYDLGHLGFPPSRIFAWAFVSCMLGNAVLIGLVSRFDVDFDKLLPKNVPGLKKFLAANDSWIPSFWPRERKAFVVGNGAGESQKQVFYLHKKEIGPQALLAFLGLLFLVAAATTQ